MPTNYNGNASATQSPASPAADGVAPELVLPADGDADNAASVAQAFKVLADYITFGQAPFANANQWAQKILSFFDARGNRRFGVDHFGFPGGALLQWTEGFTPGTPFGQAGAGSFTAGRWTIKLVGSGAASYSWPPANAYTNPPLPSSLTGTSPDSSRQLILVLDGSSAANTGELRLGDDSVTSTFAADTLCWVDFDVTLATVLDVNWVVGFTNTGEFVNNIQNGAFFIMPAGSGAVWHARTIVGGVDADVATSVTGSAGVNHTFRIALVGSGVDDSSQSRALFFIDGTQVADLTVELPVGSGKQMIPIFGGTVQSTIADPIMLCNGVRYGQITRIATP